MHAFRYRLATLLRIREATRDSRRAQLAEAFLAEQRLSDLKGQVNLELTDVRRRYVESATRGRLDVDQLHDLHKHQEILVGRLRSIEEQMAKIVLEIEKRRQALVVADREVRVLENLRTTLKERHVQQQQLAEMKQIDEVAGQLMHSHSAVERHF